MAGAAGMRGGSGAHGVAGRFDRTRPRLLSGAGAGARLPVARALRGRRAAPGEPGSDGPALSRGRQLRVDVPRPGHLARWRDRTAAVVGPDRAEARSDEQGGRHLHRSRSWRTYLGRALHRGANGGDGHGRSNRVRVPAVVRLAGRPDRDGQGARRRRRDPELRRIHGPGGSRSSQRHRYRLHRQGSRRRPGGDAQAWSDRGRRGLSARARTTWAAARSRNPAAAGHRGNDAVFLLV